MGLGIRLAVFAALGSLTFASTSAADPQLCAPLPAQLFPPDNWWNQDVYWAPVDWNSDNYINFIGWSGADRMAMVLGGDIVGYYPQIWGMPYIVVDGWQPRVAVNMEYWQGSDGVDPNTGRPYPFYPIPDEAIWQAHWIQSGWPGYVDVRADHDRHMVIVDRDNNHLFELWNVWFDVDSWQWYAGAGAFWDMNQSDIRPDGWGGADESGLAILPGILRYEEVYGPDEIQHALRVSVPNSNGYVFPATLGLQSTPGAIPLGGRLRLKADKDISGYPPQVQKIFRALKRYGMIATTLADYALVAAGTYDSRWQTDILIPAFSTLSVWDFEVVELGWR